MPPSAQSLAQCRGLPASLVNAWPTQHAELAVVCWSALMLVVFGYFVFGVFSGHAVYLPELFPTHIRATAVSFCNGSGRVITSFGPLIAGLLVVPFGGNFNKAAAVMTGFVVLSIIAMLIGLLTAQGHLNFHMH